MILWFVLLSIYVVVASYHFYIQCKRCRDNVCGRLDAESGDIKHIQNNMKVLKGLTSGLSNPMSQTGVHKAIKEKFDVA